MSSKWHQKKAKEAEFQLEKELASLGNLDLDSTMAKDTRGAAMGEGEEQLHERKLTKEERKALAKAKREAKKKKKKGEQQDDDEEESNKPAVNVNEILELTKVMDDNPVDDDGVDHEQADALAAEGTICTFSSSRKGVDARARDINVQNFTLQHKGTVMLDETEIVLNHGNRYCLVGRNGCGKSTFMKALGARAVPIPHGIDIFFLEKEVESSDTITALEAVMSVDEERLKLEKKAEDLNILLTTLAEDTSGEVNEETGMTSEEQQEEVMEALNSVYERLDDLDASTAEVRARSILKGLGFTHEMQSKTTGSFSGGWRMRVSLARALFIQPECLLLDGPTNHLDMEAVIWLEEYLSHWNRILLLVSHSQDFLNNVCTHTIHFTNRRKLVYYDGNYDQFIKTKTEKEENQLKQYNWEQDQIKSMKEYIARFGHGTAKNAKQAQSKEKVLAKMIRQGLTEKPDEEKPLNFKFPDPGHLPPPVLAFHDVKFAYPNCEPLYSNVNFGVDLDSRIALVGPNGAGKTTLVKLMAGELQPSLGDIRPHGHLKLGRYTQHFVDVLDLEMTPLEFFEQQYPSDSRDDLRKYLGRFGVSGRMQMQKMDELSDGQKSRVVFAKLGRDAPHILLLDEPTNSLDIESIDALAKAVNEYEGGVVLVSHDMRLISQTAKEIWICDDKTITPYKGNIEDFKMDMRAQLGIDEKPSQLRGDASVAKKGTDVKKTKPRKKEDEKKAIDVVPPPRKSVKNDDSMTAATATTASSTDSAPRKAYVPPHLRNK